MTLLKAENFVQRLKTFDPTTVPPAALTVLRGMVASNAFAPEVVGRASCVAASLARWLSAVWHAVPRDHWVEARPAAVEELLRAKASLARAHARVTALEAEEARGAGA